MLFKQSEAKTLHQLLISCVDISTGITNQMTNRREDDCGKIDWKASIIFFTVMAFIYLV